MQAALLAYVAGSPFILIQFYGIRPEYFELIFCGNTFGLIVASQINARIVTKIGPKKILKFALWWPVSLCLSLIFILLLGYGQLLFLLIKLFGFLTVHGLISPNATTLALADQEAHAGTASTVMGTFQFMLGILIIYVMGLWPALSPFPLVITMTACSMASLLLNLYLSRQDAIANISN